MKMRLRKYLIVKRVLKKSVSLLHPDGHTGFRYSYEEMRAIAVKFYPGLRPPFAVVCLVSFFKANKRSYTHMVKIEVAKKNTDEQ